MEVSAQEGVHDEELTEDIGDEENFDEEVGQGQVVAGSSTTHWAAYSWQTVCETQRTATTLVVFSAGQESAITQKDATFSNQIIWKNDSTE